LRVVLDTNVLVSGLLSPFGPPGEIARLVSSGSVVVCLDARIYAEYAAVLSRPAFDFAPDAVAALLDYIDFRGEIVAARPLTIRLPDPDDEPFLEVAIACGAECLVTGNLRHYPSAVRAGVLVLSPAEFLERVRST
jgi:putative PIN family toxin of toxin-antitoxin system